MEKYLRKKAIKSPWEFHKLPKRDNYKFIIAIPSFNEGELIIETLNSISNQLNIDFSTILVIIVINNSENENEEIIINNHKTFNAIKENNFQYEIAVIDAFDSLPIPEKSAGVGMARKIGFDLGLPYGNSKSIFIALDADTLISPNYFSILNEKFKSEKIDCLIPGIMHQKGGNELEEYAIREYENFLYSTANNLKKSGSPYGFVTMGSAMSFTISCYTKAGGIPKKTATEDFYFLQEVVKTSSVKTIEDNLVFPSARPSSRVYLGTGFRMQQAYDGKKLNELYYCDEAFNFLKLWLNIGQNGYRDPIENILSKAKKVHPKLTQFLIQNRIQITWYGLQQSCKSKEKFKHQFHCWFDALKTHRLLKYFSGDLLSSVQ